MNNLILKALRLFSVSIALLFGAVCSMTVFAQSKEFYSYTTKTVDGNPFLLSSLKGKKVLVVNVASACGLTPQYEQLQELYDEYKELGFEIIAFPANNFGNQESGTNGEIKEFCSMNFNISFPIMSKISVKGDDMDPIYQWLTEQKHNKKKDSSVAWNFQKYLINRDGTLHGIVSPKTSPNDPTIINWIKSK
jgi:glutathione peroxidase